MSDEPTRAIRRSREVPDPSEVYEADGTHRRNQLSPIFWDQTISLSAGGVTYPGEPLYSTLPGGEKIWVTTIFTVPQSVARDVVRSGRFEFADFIGVGDPGYNPAVMQQMPPSWRIQDPRPRFPPPSQFVKGPDGTIYNRASPFAPNP